jgi:hypothetical protein
MLLGLFDDLEQQAEGLALVERDAEVAELGRAEYAQVTLTARLYASAGRSVTLGVTGLGLLAGTLARVGSGWCLVESAADGRQSTVGEWVVPFSAVLWAAGLSERGVDEASRPVSARLGLGSAVRGIAAERAAIRAHLCDGTVLRGRPARVGADFVELTAGDDEAPPGVRSDPRPRRVVPFAALAALQRV